MSWCWEVPSEFSVSQVFQSQIPILRSHQDYGVHHGVGSTRTSWKTFFPLIRIFPPIFLHALSSCILQIKETTGADLWTSPFSTLDSIASRPKKCIVYRLFREFSRALLINSQSICVRSDLRVRPVIPLTLPLLKTHSLRISHHTANRFSFFCVDRHRACAACETWTSGLKLGTDEDSYSRVLCTA